ncbi:hypothetical protein [Actinotalea sp. C106]|uniref:hypothetical protein n=1 Tax=Actinotalea sp. C106 TaxID=2908644 RepID=UPI0020278DA1|nr:hypothetical protein [Actinotalea sp. C106]
MTGAVGLAVVAAVVLVGQQLGAGRSEPASPGKAVTPTASAQGSDDVEQGGLAGPGWTPTDPEVTAEGLPLVEGRVLMAAQGDAGALRLVVESQAGRGSAANVILALEEAGYAVDDEATDDARPFWHEVAASGPAGSVLADVSNETGGGWLVDYTFTPPSP